MIASGDFYSDPQMCGVFGGGTLWNNHTDYRDFTPSECGIYRLFLSNKRRWVTHDPEKGRRGNLAINQVWPLGPAGEKNDWHKNCHTYQFKRFATIERFTTKTSNAGKKYEDKTYFSSVKQLNGVTESRQYQVKGTNLETWKWGLGLLGEVSAF